VTIPAAIAWLHGPKPDCETYEVLADPPVAGFPLLECSIREVRRAGEIIASPTKWTAQTEPEIREAFRIANNWRDAHAFPMRSVRGHLLWYMRANNLDGVTAARLKRMQAIRRKLRRISGKLNQVQDLGGCRVILPSIRDVQNLIGALAANSRHNLHHQKNYINEPKDDGYRSHHLIYEYRGKGDTKIFDDRRIEVQLRTRLQHAWATAVESVGLMRGEYLKGDQGSQEWLRLFKLMSAEFALAENCPEPSDAPSHPNRVKEIRELDDLLRASDVLDTMTHVVRWVDSSVPPDPRQRAQHYLLKYNLKTREVEIHTEFNVNKAVQSYDAIEFVDNMADKETYNVVLVEVDKAESLQDAYPNYFGDVQLFRDQLKKITKRGAAVEYTVKPQQSVAPRRKENPNLAWFKRRIRWR
jgi:RelA/SpoT family protein